MNKKIGIILFIIIIIAILVWFFFLRLDEPKKAIEWVEHGFDESNTILDNPDRGFYIQIPIEEYERLKTVREEGYRMVLLTIDLIDYYDSEIPTKKLKMMQEALAEAQKNQIGIIFRAAYGFWDKCKEPSTKEGFAAHIEQLCQILNDYSSTIICVQAGMLGAYGEWHHGAYLSEKVEDEKDNKAIRIYILEQWENFLNEKIPVAVRRPRFIREAQEASILEGRLAYHNDGLLGSESDLGTFDDLKFSREKELAWMDSYLEQTPNGGEMPALSEYSGASNADYEFSKMHVSYLNKMYNVEVLDSWETEQLNNQNAKTYIENHLGYRIYVSNIKSQKTWEEDKLQLEIEITNSGYGTLPNKYNTYIYFSGTEAVMIYKIDVPEFHTISCGETATMHISLDIPEHFLLEEDEMVWDIGLKIADSMNQNQEEQWIKFANDGFNATNGFYTIATYQKEGDIYWFR